MAVKIRQIALLLAAERKSSTFHKFGSGLQKKEGPIGLQIIPDDHSAAQPLKIGELGLTAQVEMLVDDQKLNEDEQNEEGED